MGRHVVFHSLRHSLATMLQCAGVAPRVVMELMRHSGMRLVAKAYTDTSHLPTFDELKKLARVKDSTIEAKQAYGKGANKALFVPVLKPGDLAGGLCAAWQEIETWRCRVSSLPLFCCCDRLRTRSWAS